MAPGRRASHDCIRGRPPVVSAATAAAVAAAGAAAAAAATAAAAAVAAAATAAAPAAQHAEPAGASHICQMWEAKLGSRPCRDACEPPFARPGATPARVLLNGSLLPSWTMGAANNSDRGLPELLLPPALPPCL